MTDDDLRAAYRRTTMTRSAADRAGCPAPEAVAALVAREGSESGRLATLDHVMSCSACHRDFELLRAIDTAGHHQGRTLRRPVGWQRPLALAVAASLALAVGFGPGRDWLEDQRADTMRGDGDAIAVVRPGPGAAITADSMLFTWRATDGASRYTIELLTLDGAVRLATTTTDTNVVLFGLADMPPGDYRWWVRAALPGGERRSELRGISIDPR